ncbi:MAG: hypothetical protein AAGK33_06055 [Pseudomonadota bacterium]
MEAITIPQFVGLLGFLTYMGGFAAQQFGVIHGDSRAFSILNIVAASLVLVSLSEAFNLASALIQVGWITIAAIGLTLRSMRREAEQASK